jgi:hypothetical protein
MYNLTKEKEVRMGLATIILIAILGLFLAFKFLHFSLKAMNITILSIAVIATFVVCAFNPVMHKQFSIDIIDYIVKFNDDGTTTTTKQTTRTILQKNTPEQNVQQQPTRDF